MAQKRLFTIELTVPMEENIVRQHAAKAARYAWMRDIDPTWTVMWHEVEFGCTNGGHFKHVHHCWRSVGLSSAQGRRLTKRCQELARLSSCKIWACRWFHQMDRRRLLHWSRAPEETEQILTGPQAPIYRGGIPLKDIHRAREQLRQLSAANAVTAPGPVATGTHWRPERMVLPENVVVRALAEGDVSFSPRQFSEGRRGFNISRDGMTGAAPTHDVMVDVALRHIGSGTRESHPALSFTRDPVTACFFAKGLREARRSAKRLVFVDLNTVGAYLDVSSDSRCAQLGITGRQRRLAAAASEVIVFQPVTSVISFVDVTPIFENGVGQSLAKVKTAREFKERISSAQLSCLNGILRTVMRLAATARPARQDRKRKLQQPDELRRY